MSCIRGPGITNSIDKLVGLKTIKEAMLLCFRKGFATLSATRAPTGICTRAPRRELTVDAGVASAFAFEAMRAGAIVMAPFVSIVLWMAASVGSLSRQLNGKHTVLHLSGHGMA